MENESKKKCTSCGQIKQIVSCDAYGQYCNRCDELNWNYDNFGDD